MAQRIFTLITAAVQHTSAFAGLFDRSLAVRHRPGVLFLIFSKINDLTTLSWQVKRVTTFTINKSASRQAADIAAVQLPGRRRHGPILRKRNLP